MRQITFIRTAPYSYLIEGLNLYNSFDYVAQSKHDVSISSASADLITHLRCNLVGKQKVYCSPRKRSIQTAKLISGKINIVDELVEIRFNMSDFITERNFFNHKGEPRVRHARKLFVSALISNKLEEKYIDVLQRVKSILNTITDDTSKKITFVTHGFIMKVIEAYIRDPSIQNNPAKLRKYFTGNSETFKFCEGYTVDYKSGQLMFDRYIRT